MNNSRNQAALNSTSTASSFFVGSNQAQSTGGNGSNTASTNATKSVSSLVRLALSTNFPSSFLDGTQSYPTLAAAAGGGTNSGSSNSGRQLMQPSVTLSETEQVSLEEFLESCRATSLLAELEDDEELPEADDDDNDDDDPNDDEDDYDENYPDDEGFETTNPVSSGIGGPVVSESVSGSSVGMVGSATTGSNSASTSARHLHHPYHHSRNMGTGHGMLGGGRRKTWDDEHVLKRKFSALIPAFDPRPGRTNIAQTTDFDIVPPPTVAPPDLSTEGQSVPETEDTARNIQPTQHVLSSLSTKTNMSHIHFATFYV